MKSGLFSPFPGLRRAAVLAGSILLGWPAWRASAAGVFQFHHERILGTSLDLQVAAPDATKAGLAEKAVLAEVERLRRILSGYDPASEISRLNVADGPVVASQDLMSVLRSYDVWQKRSQGAYCGHSGGLIELWSNAEKTGKLPDDAALAPLVKAAEGSGWRIDAPSRSVTRLAAKGTLNVNSLGKGYIVTKAAVAAKKAVPDLTGLLVNIGGDIYASGGTDNGGPWEIAVADPQHSEDNAAPLTKIRLVDRAVSSSGAYERGFHIGGERFSHILDPRTGRPARGVAGATVIANNNAYANAMATSLCVLSPDEGLKLVKSIPGAECLIVGDDGKHYRSPGFAAYEKGAPPVAGDRVSGSGWPTGWQVSIEIELKTQTGRGGRRGAKRPFVAVWVEDASGKRVRTVAVWGRERKYLKDLRTWWSEAGNDPEWAASVTRATRNAGKHRLQWDGTDDKGRPLPPGSYTIKVEANREHGTYAIEGGQINCGKSAARATIKATSEFGETQLSFGPANQ